MMYQPKPSTDPLNVNPAEDLPFTKEVNGKVNVYLPDSNDLIQEKWTGVCVDGWDVKKFWYVGYKNGQQSLVPLNATQYHEALQEVLDRKLHETNESLYADIADDVKRRVIHAADYTICSHGVGSLAEGWYALLPGETEFFDNANEVAENPNIAHRQNYLGFFASEKALLEEVFDDLASEPGQGKKRDYRFRVRLPACHESNGGMVDKGHRYITLNMSQAEFEDYEGLKKKVYGALGKIGVTESDQPLWKQYPEVQDGFEALIGQAIGVSCETQFIAKYPHSWCTENYKRVIVCGIPIMYESYSCNQIIHWAPSVEVIGLDMANLCDFARNQTELSAMNI